MAFMLPRRTDGKFGKPVLISNPEVDLLKRRLHDLADALHANGERLRACAPGSYLEQELESERSDLQRQVRINETRLTDLTSTPTPEQLSAQMAREKRRQAIVDAHVSERTETITRWASTLEKMGDHRAARIWRAELIGLRERVEKEYPQ